MYKIIIICIIIAISACKNKEDKPDFYLQKGIASAKSKSYQSCIMHLNKIDEIAPYSEESKNAQPILIFCHYANKDYETMYSEIENFESLYPTSSHLAYIYYLKALSYYRIIKNHKKTLQIIENLEHAIAKVNLLDQNGQYLENLNKLRPFIEYTKESHFLYIANNYATTNNFISSAARYTKLYEETTNEDTQKIIANSMQDVMLNMGIVKK